MIKKYLTYFLAPIILFSCNQYSRYDLKFNPGLFELGDINSKFDDYNLAGPSYFGINNNVVYSTNVGSGGNNFDIWVGKIDLMITGGFDDNISYPETKSSKVSPFMHNKINSDANEFGPIFFYKNKDLENKQIDLTNEDQVFDGNSTFLFASDRTEDKKLDIYFYNGSGEIKSFFGNKQNSDEAYPTYDYKRNTLYFTSNRDGQFDIYKYENQTGNTEFNTWLNDKSLSEKITKVEELSSSKNEKCPYILDDYMVFVSDREDGRGGFDIYLSKFENNKWSKPENIQNLISESNNFEINSKFDEYRPSIYIDSYNNKGNNNNKILVFSSNRTGGKGGFDLYISILPSNI